MISVVFDPYLGYQNGLSVHSFLFFGSAFLYLVFGLAVTVHTQRNVVIAKGNHLYTALCLLLLTIFFEKLMSGVSVIVIELNVGPSPVLTQFAANILFLWNIAYLYMFMMMIATGWVITKCR